MNPDIAPHRRNLLAISVSMILFFLGGGCFEGKFTLIGGVKLSSTLPLEIGAVVLWLYFLWEFWRRAQSFWSPFSQEWRKVSTEDPQLNQIAQAHVRANPDMYAAHPGDNHERQIAGVRGKVRGRFPNWKLDCKGFSYFAPADFDVVEPHWPIQRRTLEIIFKVALYREAFSDYFVPYFVALAVPVSWLIGLLIY